MPKLPRTESPRSEATCYEILEACISPSLLPDTSCQGLAYGVLAIQLGRLAPALSRSAYFGVGRAFVVTLAAQNTPLAVIAVT